MITMTTVPASSPHNSYLCLVEALGIASCCWDYCSLILRRLTVEHTFPLCMCSGIHTFSGSKYIHLSSPKMPLSPSLSLSCVCVCAQHTVSGEFLHSIPIHGNAFHVLHTRRVKIEVFIVALTDWLSVCLSVRAFGEKSSPHQNSHKSNAMVDFLCATSVIARRIVCPTNSCELKRKHSAVRKRQSQWWFSFVGNQIMRFFPLPSKPVEWPAMFSINWLNRCEHTTAQNKQNRQKREHFGYINKLDYVTCAVGPFPLSSDIRIFGHHNLPTGMHFFDRLQFAARKKKLSVPSD